MQASAWWNATECWLNQWIACPIWYDVRRVTFCSSYGDCLYNGTDRYPHGFCIKN